MQLEAGFTLQTSLYDEAVEYIEGVEPRREFLRTPNHYGYLTYSLTPGDRFNASLSSVYTGPMELVHYAGAPEQSVDEYVTSGTFFEFGLKLGYTFNIKVLDSGLELFAGEQYFNELRTNSNLPFVVCNIKKYENIPVAFGGV